MISPSNALEALRTLALGRGGRCLSGTYLGTKTKLEWMCSEGHVWCARPENIKQGKWCPTCNGSVPHGLPAMRQLALSRGGACLSSHYVNARTPLRWACALGHEW